jgi:hypothetical protein
LNHEIRIAAAPQPVAWLSLAPGFSPVVAGERDDSRFNGFLRGLEAVETARSLFGCGSTG